MYSGDVIIENILKGFVVGATFHILVWLMTRGLVWLGNAFNGKNLE